jgi:hypothetical protein
MDVVQLRPVLKVEFRFAVAAPQHAPYHQVLHPEELPAVRRFVNTAYLSDHAANASPRPNLAYITSQWGIDRSVGSSVGEAVRHIPVLT